MNTDNAVMHEYLRCTEGTSDKVYNIALNRINGCGYSYEIIAEYGRTDGVLKEISKGTYASLTQAREEYWKLVNEKYRKNYYTRVTHPIETVNTKIKEIKRKNEEVVTQARKQRIQENIDEGVRRIDFDL